LLCGITARSFRQPAKGVLMCIHGALGGIRKSALSLRMQRFDNQPLSIGGHFEFCFLRNIEQFQDGLFDYQTEVVSNTSQTLCHVVITVV
jgi:hypothetical protein